MTRRICGARWMVPGMVLWGLISASAAPGDFVPAEYRSGAVPSIPVQAVGGGEVFLEAAVDTQGMVSHITVLRTTPPFTEPVVQAVQTWRLSRAEDDAD